MCSTHTYMSLNHNRHAIVKETCRHPHRYIQTFIKHTDILIPYQIHTYHRHAETTYTHTPHWHIHTPTHIFIFTHSNLKELALNSETWKQHQVKLSKLYLYVCV